MAATENENMIESGDHECLRVECALQDRLRDGTGDCPSDALTEILEVAAEELRAERDG
jgi:hypothetical protein